MMMWQEEEEAVFISVGSKWLWSSLLIWLEVLSSVAGLLAIFIRGPENLWSPWSGISAPYPCATALANALALALPCPCPSSWAYRECFGRCKKSHTKKDGPGWRKKNHPPGWTRENPGRPHAKTGGESNILLARTSICLK